MGHEYNANWTPKQPARRNYGTRCSSVTISFPDSKLSADFAKESSSDPVKEFKCSEELTVRLEKVFESPLVSVVRYSIPEDAAALMSAFALPVLIPAETTPNIRLPLPNCFTLREKKK